MFKKFIFLVGVMGMFSIMTYFILDLQPPLVPVDDTPIYHDWECAYIIRDSYHRNTSIHYIDEYIINADRSISFVGDDGLVCTIPYPYFQIIKNEKQTD